MNLEDLYKTQLWQDLNRNLAFENKFHEVLKKAKWYANEKDIVFSVKDDVLIVRYQSRIQNRDLDCQIMSDAVYEFSFDKENKLLVNEKYGTLRSNYGHDIFESDGGVLDTTYTCNVYDPDGIELSYQRYSDTYILNKEQFNVYKEGFFSALDNAYNPNLVYYVNLSVIPKPGIIGENGKYYRDYRSINDLGIVDRISCLCGKDGMLSDLKHELYFNSFLSQQSAYQPELIHVISGYPFASIDDKNKMHFNPIFAKLGLGNDNYKIEARKRFLAELKEERLRLEQRDIDAKYDLMIGRLEEELSNEKGTK